MFIKISMQIVYLTLAVAVTTNLLVFLTYTLFKPLVVSKYILGKANTGKLELCTKNHKITIKNRNFLTQEDGTCTSHPLKWDAPIGFENKNVYCLYILGGDKKVSHISLSTWENFRFLWLQKKHWLQKEENIRYIINIVFLVLGLVIGYLQINKQA